MSRLTAWLESFRRKIDAAALGRAPGYVVPKHVQILEPPLRYRDLDNHQRVRCWELNEQAFGESLARAVADKLALSTKALIHYHRDYCGIGLFYEAGVFTMSRVDDGWEHPDAIMRCEDFDDFVSWLAQESDRSMAFYGSRFNNQTISRLRLEWYLEPHYSPVWNDFALYSRERAAS